MVKPISIAVSAIETYVIHDLIMRYGNTILGRLCQHTKFNTFLVKAGYLITATAASAAVTKLSDATIECIANTLKKRKENRD